MANATAIAVDKLVANAAGVTPTVSTLDTGSTAVTLLADVEGLSGQMILEVTNNAAAANALSVTVKAQTGKANLRGGLGDLVTSIAQNATAVIGPFEAARFVDEDGKVSVTFTPAASTVAASIKAFLLPKQ